MRVVLNSARYWQDGDPTDGAPGILDDTLDMDGDPLTPGDPCSKPDSEREGHGRRCSTPLRLHPVRRGPQEARHESRSRQVREQSGMLPWAVPEVDPAAVAAIFVDENTGEVLDYQLLMKKDDASLPVLGVVDVGVRGAVTA